MISKYEIIPSIFKFMFLRYTRLVPMLSIIVLINFVILRVYQKPNIDILDSLPSILIIDPQIFNSIFNTNTFNWVDNSFWTLFVEIRFYLIFGLVIKILGSCTLLVKKIVLSALCLFSQVIYLASDLLNLEFIHKLLFWILIPDYFIYFLVGVILYSSKSYKEKSLIIGILPLGLTYIIMQVSKLPFAWNILLSQRSITLIVYFLFIIFAFYMSKYLIFKISALNLIAKVIGFPSYISYLIHQNLFLFLYPTFFKNFDPLLFCLILYSFIILLSMFLSKNIEPRLIKLVRSQFSFR